MNKWIWWNLLLIFGICFAIQGCDNDQPSADQIAHQQQESIEQQGQRVVGLPNISNFAEKKLLKTILELRDNPHTINYVYLFSEYSGKLIPIGKCYGYAMPYSTQFTNPQKIAYEGANVGTAVLPQADPNGLFSPASAEGTWVDMINPKTGEHGIVYFEPRVTVSPFPLVAGQE